MSTCVYFLWRRFSTLLADTTVIKEGNRTPVRTSVVLQDSLSLLPTITQCRFLPVLTVILFVTVGFSDAAMFMHWRLDETGGTYAKNSVPFSDSTLGGTLTGTPTWAPTQGFGGAIYIDSSVDKVISNSPVNFGTAFTASVWVKADGLAQVWSRVFMGESYANGFYIGMDGSGNWLFIVKGAWCTSTTAFTANQWQHVVGTYDGITLRLYVNGVLRNSCNMAGLMVPTQTVRIGTETGNSQYFKGWVDDVRLYDTCLSASEVASLYSPIQSIVKVIETGDNTIVEEGSSITDTYSIQLLQQPTSNVNISINDISTPDQVALSPTVLTFTSANWQTPQTISVSAIDDDVPDGPSPLATQIRHSIVSSDSSFSNKSFNVTVTVADNDCLRYESTDFNLDCMTDIHDLAVLSDNWLSSTLLPTSSSVISVDRNAETWWSQRHQSILSRISQGNVDMIFVGDSITNFWESTGLSIWNSHYAPRNAVNLGFSGDLTQHVLWRLDRGEIDGISPKLAVVMIGTNNGNDNAEQVGEGIIAVCQRIRTKCPATKILLLAVFPRGQYPSSVREKNERASLYASKIADNNMVYYMDIGQSFLQPDGSMLSTIMPDYLHPSLEGYQIWANNIEAMVTALMN